MNVRDKAIPKELLDKAEAIAVFPDVVKAAFIFGGKGGQGVVSRRAPKLPPLRLKNAGAVQPFDVRLLITP